jgi:hypothetical protein
MYTSGSCTSSEKHSNTLGRASVDEWLLLVADQSHTEVIEGIGVGGPYD